MGLSKTEVNLNRLLVAAPQQQNHEKLIHYVATLREQLEQLAEERTPDGLPRVSKAKVHDYSEKVEAVAAKLDDCAPNVEDSQESLAGISVHDTPSIMGQSPKYPSSGLRRRAVLSENSEDRTRDSVEADQSIAVKLNSEALGHIEKHRKLQEDLTDEMVGLAQQLRQSSLIMSLSIKDTEKILDSTEKAVEDSLGRTGHANARAMEVNSRSFKTTCFTWLVFFAMTCIFVMVVMLIRVT